MQLMNKSESATMTSREIAELTGKRHDHVLVDIRKMLVEIQSSEKSGDYKDSRGRTYQELVLDKEQTLILVSGYSIKMRAAIIRRWQELEAQQPALPDFTNPVEAARAWADAKESEMIANEKLAIAAPKAQVYDRVIERGVLLTATQVWQKIGMSAIVLNRHLTELSVYNRAVKRGKVFQQWFIDKGFGEMKLTAEGHSQPLFTNAGEVWVIERLTSEGVE